MEYRQKNMLKIFKPMHETQVFFIAFQRLHSKYSPVPFTKHYCNKRVYLKSKFVNGAFIF